MCSVANPLNTWWGMFRKSNCIKRGKEITLIMLLVGLYKTPYNAKNC